MRIEQKYISLPLAQKLQKVAKKNNYKLPKSELVYINETLRYHRQDNLYNPIPAYDRIELRKILPHDFKSYKCVGQPPQWECSNDNLNWHCNAKKGIYREAIHADNEVEVSGLMIVYLIKNKLLK